MIHSCLSFRIRESNILKSITMHKIAGIVCSDQVQDIVPQKHITFNHQTGEETIKNSKNI